MLSALSDAGVEFLVVGAHALAVHGRPRATGDLDVWINPTADNVANVWRALSAFGAPLDDLREEDLTKPEVVFQIGIVPKRIDILTSVTGLVFEEAWGRRINARYGEVEVPVIGREDLIRNKRELGRPRDLADADELEATD